jgi:hypothetical protein
MRPPAAQKDRADQWTVRTTRGTAIGRVVRYGTEQFQAIPFDAAASMHRTKKAAVTAVFASLRAAPRVAS